MFPFRSELERRMAAWAVARQGVDEFPLRLRRRRLYVLPTRAGLGFAAVVLGMLLAALNYGNGIALGLAGLLAGLALVAMHQCHHNLLELQIDSITTTAAFAGGRGLVTLALANDARNARLRVQVDARGAVQPAVVDLAPTATARAVFEVSTPRRGQQHLERVRISTTHPFGLFRAWTWVSAPLAIIVFPRPRGGRPLPRPDGSRHESRRSGDGGEQEEWRGLRPFRDGDSPRQVAWKAYARGAPLLVKEYASSGTAERRFDYGRLPGLDTEARLEQLARWIVDADASAERYGLVLPGVTFAPDRGAEHRRRALTALALHGLAAP
ncbi:MAG: DUF58 domain-containing protein [Steroidobacteraceae bacterium]